MYWKAISYIFLFAALVRWLVAQHPYSGQGNPPMYGDYEAQRHWMEITSNLPPSQWYNNGPKNDLKYWGLDYPPLTAYHMMLLGDISKQINSTWVALEESKGIESYGHKLFMRLTVWICDISLYMTAIVYYFFKTEPFYRIDSNSKETKQRVASLTALMLLYPGQILIDHGHFQYNCVFLGLTLWSIIFILKQNYFIASFLFTLALSYKQMALYYSLPFFWYILSVNLRRKPFWKGLLTIFSVGILVIVTFGVIFLPIASDRQSFMQVIDRIFPFSRGLFEDKVANFWCSASIFIKLRQIYQQENLLKISILLTMFFTVPSGVNVLIRPSQKAFKYCLVNSSLAFFLFSFQVHEKTILVPALAVLILYREHPIASNWFAIISTFSLHPLLIKDGQTIPYASLLLIFSIISTNLSTSDCDQSEEKKSSASNVITVTYYLSIVCCLILSLLGQFAKPPTRYPDLYAVVNSFYSCVHFFMFMLYFNSCQFFKKTHKILYEKKNE